MSAGRPRTLRQWPHVTEGERGEREGGLPSEPGIGVGPVQVTVLVHPRRSVSAHVDGVALRLVIKSTRQICPSH